MRKNFKNQVTQKKNLFKTDVGMRLYLELFEINTTT